MDNMELYFNGEKQQCLIGAIISVSCIIVSVFFIFQQKPFLKGMSYAVITLAILLLIICIGVIFRAPKDIKRVSKFQIEKPASLQFEEIPRMEKVMKSFNIIKKVEIAVLIIGLILTVFFWRNELIRGVAIGLIVMSVALYTFDHIAESRGETYIRYLKSL